MQTTSNPAGTQQAKSATAIPLHIAMSLTNGGRSLNAIWYLNIPPCQKLILQFLGSEMNFNESFSETIRISRKALAQFICVSIKTMNTAIQSLLESGYIKKINHIDVYECNETSEYGLTEKLFDDYAQFLDERYVQRDISLKAANYKRSMGMIGDSPNEGGRVNLNLGGRVNLNPLYSPSSSPEIPKPQSETKTENPCHNGGVDLIRTSITPSDHVKKENSPPLVNGGQVVSFVKAMAFTYKVGRLGNYDWEIANEAAERFISERGLAACSILKSWATSKSDFDRKCVKVGANMFDRLWTAMEAENND